MSEEPESYEDYVARLAVHLMKVTLAGEYSMELVHVKSIPDYPSALADICIDTKYLCFTIRLANKLKQLFTDGRYRDFAMTLCHEFCHVLTEPLYEQALFYSGGSTRPLEEVRERQTQRVCNVVMGLIPEEVWKRK